MDPNVEPAIRSNYNRIYTGWNFLRKCILYDHFNSSQGRQQLWNILCKKKIKMQYSKIKVNIVYVCKITTQGSIAQW